MARKKKNGTEGETEGEGTGEPRPGRNGFDPDTVRGFIGRVDALKTDLASERGSYMATCKGIRADITEVFDEAKEAGIPKKELKAVIKARELEEKARAARDDLEGDQQDTFDAIRHALGDLADTPLGGAALAQAGDQPGA